MTQLFYLSGAIALLASVLVITSKNAVHAAVYLVVSLLGVACVFFSLGSAFVAALEVIVYAGGIMVLILFVIMLLQIAKSEPRSHSLWFKIQTWTLPALLVLVMLIQLAWAVQQSQQQSLSSGAVALKQISTTLFGPYLLGVELSSLLLLAGLVGAYHLVANRKHSGNRT